MRDGCGDGLGLRLALPDGLGAGDRDRCTRGCEAVVVGAGAVVPVTGAADGLGDSEPCGCWSVR